METEASDNVDKDLSDLQRKDGGGRHRKKQLYQQIMNLMEFYLSDSNLRKDRFFSQLLQESPEIEVSVFLKCNKLARLTHDPDDVVKALRKSKLLEVTEDGTKVRRTVVVQDKPDVDECTIYVEKLPPEAEHDYIESVFSKYGKVTYVSLPKFKSTGKLKGFAFVEFSTKEEAAKALEAYTEMGCRLPSTMPPESLISIQTFEGEQSNLTKQQENLPPRALAPSNGTKPKDSVQTDESKGIKESAQTEKSKGIEELVQSEASKGIEELVQSEASKGTEESVQTDEGKVESVQTKKMPQMDGSKGIKETVGNRKESVIAEKSDEVRTKDDKSPPQKRLRLENEGADEEAKADKTNESEDLDTSTASDVTVKKKKSRKKKKNKTPDTSPEATGMQVLSKLAELELMQEAKRGAQRVETLGALGWIKPHTTNKTFLSNTLKSVLLSNAIANRKSGSSRTVSSHHSRDSKLSRKSSRSPISRSSKHSKLPTNRSRKRSECSARKSSKRCSSSTLSSKRHKSSETVDVSDGSSSISSLDYSSSSSPDTSSDSSSGTVELKAHKSHKSKIKRSRYPKHKSSKRSKSKNKSSKRPKSPESRCSKWTGSPEKKTSSKHKSSKRSKSMKHNSSKRSKSPESRSSKSTGSKHKSSKRAKSSKRK